MWNELLPEKQKEFWRKISEKENDLFKRTYPQYKLQKKKKGNGEEEDGDEDYDKKPGKPRKLLSKGLPGFLKIEDIARDYHKEAKANGWWMLYPIPENHPSGFQEWNISDYDGSPLVQPKDFKEPTDLEEMGNKRKESSIDSSESGKAKKTGQGQKASAALTMSSISSSPYRGPTQQTHAQYRAPMVEKPTDNSATGSEQERNGKDRNENPNTRLLAFLAQYNRSQERANGSSTNATSSQAKPNQPPPTKQAVNEPARQGLLPDFEDLGNIYDVSDDDDDGDLFAAPDPEPTAEVQEPHSTEGHFVEGPSSLHEANASAFGQAALMPPEPTNEAGNGQLQEWFVPDSPDLTQEDFRRRKRMKKNVQWTPSQTMIAHELDQNLEAVVPEASTNYGPITFDGNGQEESVLSQAASKTASDLPDPTGKDFQLGQSPEPKFSEVGTNYKDCAPDALGDDGMEVDIPKDPLQPINEGANNPVLENILDPHLAPQLPNPTMGDQPDESHATGGNNQAEAISPSPPTNEADDSQVEDDHFPSFRNPTNELTDIVNMDFGDLGADFNNGQFFGDSYMDEWKL